MAFIYRAYPDEAALLRELFGDTITDVMFWDYDFPTEQDENWELAQATLADGTTRDLKPSTCDRWEEIEALCLARGETVKFGLTVPPKVFNCRYCGYPLTPAAPGEQGKWSYSGGTMCREAPVSVLYHEPR